MATAAPAPAPTAANIPQPPYWAGIWPVAATTLLIHLACIGGYGYFRDELYYLACANRLDWGYVDHPPLSVAVLKLFTSVLGTHLWAVRTPGILAGCGSVILYGLVAARLGAGRLAQTMAAIFAGLTPVYAVVSHLYSMNGIDIALWAGAALLYLCSADESRRKLWLWLGLVCGLAMLNKLSGFWLVAGLGCATLFSPRRAELKTVYPWAAAGIAFAVFFPHFVWQNEHNWVTQEFVRNAAQFKMVPQPPWIILGVQAVVTNPVMATLWVLGAYWALRKPEWRPFALTYFLVIGILLLSMRSRENYPAPSYVFVVPFGAIVFGEWLKASRARFYAMLAVFVPVGVFCISLALPLLPPPRVEEIAEKSQVDVPSAEKGAKSPMQGFADMFGWPEMASAVRAVWLGLPEDERLRTPVFGMNYGESAACWYFNRNEPGFKVIGRHNQYWLWGPGDWDGRTLVVIGEPTPAILDSFESAHMVAQLNSPNSVPEEAHAPITILRGLKKPVVQFWREIRHIQ
ncbi:MAG: glycosyltransferase family 39 protein [Armatimonadetes bacterium]|nr:glycosyltransferase family 39 protein [Armatimonadota bacterium]MBS1710462.1 glycosyltransferase family 39 protein [Armatimonadota bacterium]MBX3108133.1 glycosyltransferase family 39 protein [Fimbriimonadaceae bacterium]